MKKIPEGYVICSKCNGAGVIINSNIDIRYMDESCEKCDGEGIVDWVSNVMNKPKFNLQDIIDDISRQIAEKIDKEIMSSLYSDSEQKNKIKRGHIF